MLYFCSITNEKTYKISIHIFICVLRCCYIYSWNYKDVSQFNRQAICALWDSLWTFGRHCTYSYFWNFCNLAICGPMWGKLENLFRTPSDALPWSWKQDNYIKVLGYHRKWFLLHYIPLWQCWSSVWEYCTVVSFCLLVLLSDYCKYIWWCFIFISTMYMITSNRLYILIFEAVDSPSWKVLEIV